MADRVFLQVTAAQKCRDVKSALCAFFSFSFVVVDFSFFFSTPVVLCTNTQQHLRHQRIQQCKTRLSITTASSFCPHRITFETISISTTRSQTNSTFDIRHNRSTNSHLFHRILLSLEQAFSRLLTFVRPRSSHGARSATTKSCEGFTENIAVTNGGEQKMLSPSLSFSMRNFICSSVNFIDFSQMTFSFARTNRANQTFTRVTTDNGR